MNTFWKCPIRPMSSWVPPKKWLWFETRYSLQHWTTATLKTGFWMDKYLSSTMRSQLWGYRNETMGLLEGITVRTKALYFRMHGFLCYRTKRMRYVYHFHDVCRQDQSNVVSGVSLFQFRISILSPSANRKMSKLQASTATYSLQFHCKIGSSSLLS